MVHSRLIEKPLLFTGVFLKNLVRLLCNFFSEKHNNRPPFEDDAMSLPANVTFCAAKIKKSHTPPNGNDTNVDAAGTYGNRKRGRALQPGETKVPEDQASALRGKALEQFLESEQGRTLSAREQQVLRFLSSKANKGVHWIQDNRLCSDCYWKQENIAAALGCKSAATIARAIKGLKAAGIVNSHRKKIVVNTYIVQLPLPTVSVTKVTEAPISKPAEVSVSKPTKLSVSLTSSSIEPSKKEPIPTPTRTSETTASANTSSIERGGVGGVISFEDEQEKRDEAEWQEQRVREAVDVLISNGFNSRSQARKLVQSNEQITAEVVQHMLDSIDSNPDNPIALVRLRLQEPEDVQDVVDELAEIAEREHRIERERKAAAARKAAEDRAEAVRKYIMELAMWRARQLMLALSDARIWCAWTEHVQRADFDEKTMQRIRHRIANDAWHFLAKMMSDGLSNELKTLQQHVATGTAVEDLEKLPLKCDRDDDDKERNALAKVQQHIELMKLTPDQRLAARLAKAAAARQSVEQVTTGGGK